MEIVYYFKDYKVPMYRWQHVHIIDELKTHKCNVNVISPVSYKINDEANDVLLNYIRNNEVDLFMTPHNEEDLRLDILGKIKR